MQTIVNISLAVSSTSSQPPASIPWLTSRPSSSGRVSNSRTNEHSCFRPRLCFSLLYAVSQQLGCLTKSGSDGQSCVSRVSSALLGYSLSCTPVRPGYDTLDCSLHLMGFRAMSLSFCLTSLVRRRHWRREVFHLRRSSRPVLSAGSAAVRSLGHRMLRNIFRACGRRLGCSLYSSLSRSR